MICPLPFPDTQVFWPYGTLSVEERSAAYLVVHALTRAPGTAVGGPLDLIDGPFDQLVHAVENPRAFLSMDLLNRRSRAT